MYSNIVARRLTSFMEGLYCSKLPCLSPSNENAFLSITGVLVFLLTHYCLCFEVFNWLVDWWYP